MTKNLRLWIMLAAVPIILSIIIACYENYMYGDQVYNSAIDSEDIIENERDFSRISRYEILNTEENELLLNLTEDFDISQYQTPEYINTEAELIRTQNKYSNLLNNSYYQSDALAASDEMLEMDNEGNPIFYEVEEGEWLAVIAEKLYGDKSCWHYIYEVNRDMLHSPDNIHAGMKLYLPNKEYFKIKANQGQ